LQGRARNKDRSCLARTGVAGDRISNRGYGRQLNRRVEIIVSDDAQSFRAERLKQLLNPTPLRRGFVF